MNAGFGNSCRITESVLSYNPENICNTLFINSKLKQKRHIMNTNTTFEPPQKSLGPVRDKIRFKHYSLGTETCYLAWVVTVQSPPYLMPSP
jgi:hypothetical protein